MLTVQKLEKQMFGYEFSTLSYAQRPIGILAPGVCSTLLCCQPASEDSAKGPCVPSVVASVTRSLSLTLFT